MFDVQNGSLGPFGHGDVECEAFTLLRTPHGHLSFLEAEGASVGLRSIQVIRLGTSSGGSGLCCLLATTSKEQQLELFHRMLGMLWRGSMLGRSGIVGEFVEPYVHHFLLITHSRYASASPPAAGT